MGERQGGGLLLGVIAALSSILLLQLGAALSKPAMEAHGAREMTWLRLAWAALFLLIATRPKALSYTRAQWRTALILGAAMALINLGYYESLLYLPIGVATSIQFMGPLSVAAFQLGRKRPGQLVWCAVAAIGVFLLTLGLAPDGSPQIDADPIGVAWALAAALGWGGYIVFLKQAGGLFSGLEGLTMSIVTAAAISAPFALIGSDFGISGAAIGAALGLALLVPLFPYMLELWALRRMDARRFGMLMCVEPMVSVFLGWLILDQSLTAAQLAGVALTSVAMLKVMQGKGGG
jgi:inner membrane transporter RhtA